MDCIDETANTTSLLRLAKSHGWLRYHKVSRRTSRGFFVDNRLPHFTAVIADPDGRLWAVDSWYEAGGGAPDIMPLAEWRKRGIADQR
jgi:hypothetical protein